MKPFSVVDGYSRTVASTFRGCAILALAVLAACSSSRPAPVTESRPDSRSSALAKPATPASTEAAPKPTPSPATNGESKPADGEKVHVIQKGDTMISIALQNGLDYRELAAWNNIENPNVIKLGETLRLTAPGTQIVAGASTSTPAGTPLKPGEPIATPLVITPAPTVSTSPGNTDKLKTEPKAGKTPYSDAAYAKALADASGVAASVPPAVVPTPTVPPSTVAATPAANDDVDWAWPIQPAPKGKLLATFTEASKGIDMGGAKNTPVLAAGSGKVVYSGAGLRGYGRLVIVKHNSTWLSAYAHNEKILVMEGQDVKKGEKIAEMGSSDAEQVKLHFEIRRQGKPVDPVKLLPN